MKIQYAIRSLLLVAAVVASGLALWRAIASNGPESIADCFLWHEYSTGVARQRNRAGWRHCGTIAAGMNSCLVLKHSVLDYEKYDGTGGYMLSFQLPPDPAAGDRFTFALVPTSRTGEMHPKERGFTLLLPGEFTAYHWGQASAQTTWISKDQEPEIRIKSIDEDYVVLHLKLNIPVADFYPLNIDRDFTVRRIFPDGA